MSPPSAHEIARFRELLAIAMGWQFDDSRINGLSQTLALRAEAMGASCTAYLQALALAPATTGEIAALARELTVTETYFLRHADQFSALVQTALPDRLEAAPDGAPIEVLSIGCASGEEPYSIAMMVREYLPAAAQRVIIIGADLNPQMLERARRAHYSAWALRDLPAATVARWFHKEGTGFALDEQLVRAVRFEARNLARDDAEFWRPGRFDAIFCRNLLMYFAPEQAQAAVARLRTALAVGGYLFLGHAETLRGLSNDFHVCHSNDAFFYRHDKNRPHASTPTPARSVVWRQAAAPGDASWVDTICQASERIAALAASHAKASNGMDNAAPRPPDLSPVRELFARERYGQALAHLDDLGFAYERDPDVQLLRAVTLAHAGDTAAADATCRTLIAGDEMNAGAHYVLALCREASGDFKAAREEDEIAAYLDPTFAMPRLHLGLLARRSGDKEAAMRELARAAALLQHEDSSRLLMFGGGFQREALIAMCRPSPARPGAR